MTTETTKTEAPKPVQATIQDAVAALFADKEAAAKPKEEPNGSGHDASGTADAGHVQEAVQPAESAEAGEAEPAAETKEEPAAEAPKISASDAALQISKLKKQLAAAQAKQATQQQAAPETPEKELIDLARKIKAAGGDPVKTFEATGLNLATIVADYERQMAEPDYPDPLAAEIKRLAEEIATLKNEKKVAADEATVTGFLTETAKRIQSGGESLDAVAAMEDEGIAFVRTLVETAAESGKPIMLDDAIKKANEHFARVAKKLARTQTVKSEFKTSQTKKPTVPQQAPAAAVASPAKTPPVNIRDVIAREIDALLG